MSVPLLEEYTFSIVGDYSGYKYKDVVNRTNAMEAKLGTSNNVELDIYWLDVFYISSVQIQHQFVCDRRSNTEVYHEEIFLSFY